MRSPSESPSLRFLSPGFSGAFRQTALGFLPLLGAVLLFLAVQPGLAEPAPGSPPARPLLIYAIDVEGGQATLLVSPSGASLLVDTGWPGENGRDATRIQDAMRDAGIAKLDHVLITHFHVDHVGGLPELAKRVPIGEFLDHGVNREDSDITRRDFAAYLKVPESMEKPAKYFYNNTAGTLNLMEQMVLAGVKKMVFSSTCAVYGEPERIPLTEDQPKNPTSPYGLSKWMSESALSYFGHGSRPGPLGSPVRAKLVQ